MTTKEINMKQYTLIYRIGENWYFLQFDDLEKLSKFIANPQIDEFHLAQKPTL